MKPSQGPVTRETPKNSEGIDCIRVLNISYGSIGIIQQISPSHLMDVRVTFGGDTATHLLIQKIASILARTLLPVHGWREAELARQVPAWNHAAKGGSKPASKQDS